jgi:hypothetical protein
MFKKNKLKIILLLLKQAHGSFPILEDLKVKNQR